MTRHSEASPIVIAIDLGTSSVRALAFDARCVVLEGTEAQVPYSLKTGTDGTAEADPKILEALTAEAVDGCLAHLGRRSKAVAAVAMTSFWHGLMGVDRENRPLTPAYSWADTRSASDAALLRREVDEPGQLHRTGCRIHSSYWPAKLRWLRRTSPGVFSSVDRWCGFSEHLLRGWCEQGSTGVSISMASGTGMLDVHELDWDAATLVASGIRRDQLSPLVPANSGGRLGRTMADRWPALAEVPWYPALGDGACANVGSGAIGPGRIAITIGTSGAMRLILPAPRDRRWVAAPELWAYRLDEERAVLGGALSNGGNLIAWMRSTLQVTGGSDLEESAARIAPDDHGLTFLPFLAGERSPKWHDQADGVIAGLRLSTTSAAIYRAGLEAAAFRFGAIYADLLPLADTHHQIIANGGALLQSPLWLQITADVLGHDVLALPPTEEASARGSAAMALVSIGVVHSLADLPDPADKARAIRSDTRRHEVYRQAAKRQALLEQQLIGRDSTWHQSGVQQNGEPR